MNANVIRMGDGPLAVVEAVRGSAGALGAAHLPTDRQTFFKALLVHGGLPLG